MLASDLEAHIRGELPRLSPPQTEELARAVRRLAEVFQPDRINVFGSQARGTAGPDSDIDLLIVVPAAAEPTYRLATAAYGALAPLRLPLEVVFMTRADFDARAPAVASLPGTVLREGRLLYAA